jgi:hypothetical protein
LAKHTTAKNNGGKEREREKVPNIPCGVHAGRLILETFGRWNREELERSEFVVRGGEISAETN